MRKKIHTALISVFHKKGLTDIVKILADNNVTIYSTGGTQQFLEQEHFNCIPVESLTHFPSILGGRVKTLHPAVFGGILGKRDDSTHLQEMAEHHIPQIDLVIVDLYPFKETVANTDDETLIIEKIDIGGPSMIRAAAKNYKDVVVIASSDEYPELLSILQEHFGATTLTERKQFASKAFDVCSAYDNSISNYFSGREFVTIYDKPVLPLRYGENPHQQASFFGKLNECFEQLQGKELSYNNLVDIDAAIQLVHEFRDMDSRIFAIIKHTNVCGIAARQTLKEAWDAALAGDSESAFGGVLICNGTVDIETASAINELFFEVLIAKEFDMDALQIIKGRKNRILLSINNYPDYKQQSKTVLGGLLIQDFDIHDHEKWDEVGGRESTATEKQDMEFANKICKHLKSNAIALVKNYQLIGKGCGQTSRIDALRQAIDKAKQFNNSLQGAVLASDAFFPFDDCVKIAHQLGITAFIQPGGSIRDNESIEYCNGQKLVMVLTGTRHFKH